MENKERDQWNKHTDNEGTKLFSAGEDDDPNVVTVAGLKEVQKELKDKAKDFKLTLGDYITDMGYYACVAELPVKESGATLYMRLTNTGNHFGLLVCALKALQPGDELKLGLPTQRGYTSCALAPQDTLDQLLASDGRLDADLEQVLQLDKGKGRSLRLKSTKLERGKQS